MQPFFIDQPPAVGAYSRSRLCGEVAERLKAAVC